jgi:DNA (cytosine-5)-methyltransferase 1
MEQARQKIKIATVCSGIGSPEQAFKELGIDHEIAFACEIDKYARQTYLANFTPNQMYQDLTAEEWDKPEQYSDLFIGGIPCQAFSLAGKRLGELDKRGLLFYDFYRYVKNQQPKVFIIENVKGLLSDNNGITFQNWCALLGRSMNTHVNMFNHDDSLLYNLHFKVLNSKDFGVPQNRERVFLIGIRNDLPNTFHFPIGERLKIRLKDILESEVDDKYYLSDESIENLMEHKKRNDEAGNGFGVKFNQYDGICSTVKIGGSGKDDLVEIPVKIAHVSRSDEGKKIRSESMKKGKDFTPFQAKKIEFKESDVMNTITCATTKDNLIMVKEATKQGYAIAKEGDSINLSNPNSETRRGRVGNQIANTLDTACNQVVVIEQPLFSYRSDNPISTENECFGTLRVNAGGKLQGVGIIHETRIRRLTPLECMRLQGYPDSYIKPCSDSQTYKQAGNSITVNVMKAIIRNLIPIL